MKLMHFSSGLAVAAAFLMALSAQTALADNPDRAEASDKGNNVGKAFPEKNSQKGLDRFNQSTRKASAKPSSKKGSGGGGNAASDGNADSRTIGKGTGNPETTTPGSGTGWSGKSD